MNEMLKGVFLTLGILVSLGFVFAIGFHTANEILGGTFSGNYSFNGSVNFDDADVSGLGGITQEGIIKPVDNSIVCNSTNEGMFRYNDISFTFEGCNGISWVTIQAVKSFTSCLDILNSGASIGDGVYTIDVDGMVGALEPVEVYCDMTYDGGGWTVVAQSNIATVLSGIASLGTSPTEGIYKIPTTHITELMSISNWWLIYGVVSGKRVKIDVTSADADTYAELSSVNVGNGISGCGLNSWNAEHIDVDGAGGVCWAYPTSANFYDMHTSASSSNGNGVKIYLR